MNDIDDSSTISKISSPEGSTNKSIQVGQGNLMLLYSADEGKLTHYVNSRTLVSFNELISFSICSLNMLQDQMLSGMGCHYFLSSICLRNKVSNAEVSYFIFG